MQKKQLSGSYTTTSLRGLVTQASVRMYKIVSNGFFFLQDKTRMPLSPLIFGIAITPLSIMIRQSTHLGGAHKWELKGMCVFVSVWGCY